MYEIHGGLNDEYKTNILKDEASLKSARKFNIIQMLSTATIM